MKKIEITARIPLLTDRLTNNSADLAGRVVGGGGEGREEAKIRLPRLFQGLA